MTKRYTGLPIEVEAVQINVRFETEEIMRWLIAHKAQFNIMFMDRVLEMPNAVGRTMAKPGDWIVRFKVGRFMIYTNDEFGSMFKEVQPSGG